jgi:GMP synthase (glutamine-hydrolysing)
METVLVLDFGAQYSQLIARRVRECRVYSEMIPYDTPLDEIRERKPAGLILSGGPASVYVDDAPEIDPAIFELDIPILGICYGMQTMAHALGGTVTRTDKSEFGKTELSVLKEMVLLDDLPKSQTCWMSHRDAVTEAPDGFEITGTTESSPVAVMENNERKLYGIQCHPEVIHTPYGTDILKNFLFNVCDCTPSWTVVSIIEDSVAEIKEQVGDEKVICGLSGGVDSSTAALLVYRAVGENLTCIYVDHGLMRKNESEQVIDAFENHFHVPLIHIEARERFQKKLADVTEPEQKRKIIGEEFIRIFEEEARKLEGARFLVQGTLYSDVIESGTRDAAKIKSHHNVGGLPADMDLELVEPLRHIFKDEVRHVAAELGLPDNMVWRQPFPGPGLGIRIIGDVTKERLDILREADFILQEEVRRAGLYRELWQSFCVLPAIRSVGVQGDERTYAYPIIIRAVTSEDAMTADWARLPYELLETISNRIINEVPGVNRVALDISSKPPSTIEWE